MAASFPTSVKTFVDKTVYNTGFPFPSTTEFKSACDEITAIETALNSQLFNTDGTLKNLTISTVDLLALAITSSHATETRLKITNSGASGKAWALNSVADGSFRINISGEMIEALRISSAGNIGIGTVSPDANSILDLTSNTKAFLPPRMTTTEMNAISSPVEGMVIYNTTTHSLYFRNSSAWGAV
jgi:hypothetical protein